MGDLKVAATRDSDSKLKERKNMPAQANANVIALQLEKVRDKVPLLYERDDILLTMIQQRGDIEKNIQPQHAAAAAVNPGGKAGSYNADGGDLGAGRGHSMTCAGFADFLSVRNRNHEAGGIRDNGRERAVENSRSENGERDEAFRAFLDKLIQTAGTAYWNDRFVCEHDVDDGDTSRRGAGVRGANAAGVRLDADDEPRHVQRVAADPISPTQTITVT